MFRGTLPSTASEMQIGEVDLQDSSLLALLLVARVQLGIRICYRGCGEGKGRRRRDSCWDLAFLHRYYAVEERNFITTAVTALGGEALQSRRLGSSMHRANYSVLLLSYVINATTASRSSVVASEMDYSERRFSASLWALVVWRFFVGGGTHSARISSNPAYVESTREGSALTGAGSSPRDEQAADRSDPSSHLFATGDVKPFIVSTCLLRQLRPRIGCFLERGRVVPRRADRVTGARRGGRWLQAL